ncbi:MAG: FecR domain-containing protein, partial [Dyadobacter sp.]
IETIIEVVNENNKVKYVQLPDGSSVVLRKNSRISYNKKFDADKRVVVLSGEAFFEVTKDPARPFFVYANELVTKVLGTSFSIKADKNDKNVLVAVKSGKVSVFSSTDKHVKEYQNGTKLSALLLTSNQQVTFERSKSRLVRSSVTGSILLNIPIENQKFIYSETPVSEVFASLEKAYGIDIEYNEQIMSHCSITATLGDEPLDNKLKWICAILEANYQISENKISITGNSCQ